MANLTNRIDVNMLMKIHGLDEYLVTSDGMWEYAEYIVERIRDRVRSGYGCAEFGGTEEELLWLEDSTIRKREWMESHGDLHYETAPSGQLLDSMYGTGRDGRINIGFDARIPDDNKKGGRGKRKSNYDIARYVSGDRPFLNPTGEELEDLVDLISADIIAEFDNI